MIQRQAQTDRAATEEPTNVPGQAAPLTEITNENKTAVVTEAPKQPAKPRARVQKQRGPPEDGIPSKTKVMVANLPYDLTEDKVKLRSPCLTSGKLLTSWPAQGDFRCV